MRFIGDISEIISGAEIICQSLGLDEEISVKKISDSLMVCEKDGKYTIGYEKPTDFFRGLSILIDKLNKGEKNFLVEQKRHFNTCGVMIDVSRNAVLKVDTVKDIIVYMAKMGINRMMLYTEDTFKMDKYPYFGYMRGGYTKDEIEEIVSYAEIFGVELVPCIQTLGHLGRTLRWDYASDIKDNENVLLIDEDKTYEFIEEMIKTARECYKTDKIHIGMDEAHGVGLGNYLRKYGFRDRVEVLTRHLNKVTGIADKYNFKPIMWSDMFFRLVGKSDDYYENDGSEELVGISENIPKQLSMVYWDYYSNSEDVYKLNINKHKMLGRPIVFAGGVWTWAGLSPNYDKTYVTTHAGLKACRACGIKDVFATMWGDDGAECSIYTSLLGMQLFSEYNYAEEVTEDGLTAMFKICTGYDREAFDVFNIDDFGDACENHDAVVSKQVFYNDILTGLLDKNHSTLDLKEHYGCILKIFDKIENQGNLQYLFEYQKQLLKVLYLKCNMGNRLITAYKADDRAELVKIANELENVNVNISIMHEMLKDIWFKNNKPFGFEHLDYRIGGLMMRIKSAKMRINDYLDGKISRIEELEEERLWFSGTETPFVHNYFTDAIMRS